MRSFGVGIALDLIPSLRKSFSSFDRRGSRVSANFTACSKMGWMGLLGILTVELLMCSCIHSESLSISTTWTELVLSVGMATRLLLWSLCRVEWMSLSLGFVLPWVLLRR